MAGSGAGGRSWTPLVVATITLTLPLALLTWQFLLVAPSLTAPGPPAPAMAVALEQPAAVGDSDPASAPPPYTAPDQPAVEPSAVTPTASPVVAQPAALSPTPAPTPAPTSAPAAASRDGWGRDLWGRESAFNFVAVGVDRRDDEIPRTDTIMIGSVDLVQRRFNLVSIPRDLLLEIPGYGYDRINAAFVYGEQFDEPGGGIGLLRRTIEWNFGIAIQHFGVIDFGCFRTAVDAIGGVTVEVPRAIVDTRYPTDDFGYKTVRFEAGRQRLDGERALEYARTRHADNDLQRIRRQQQIVGSVRQELLQLRTLPMVPTIMSGCRNMRSDLGFLDYLGLATAFRQFGDADVALRAIDEDMVAEGYTRGGAAVLLPRWEPIRALVRDSFRPAGAAAVPAPRARDEPQAVKAPTARAQDQARAR